MPQRFIYALTATGDRTVRYIGQTANMPKRYLQHIRGDMQFGVKYFWVRRCQERGDSIRMRLLARTVKPTKEECRMDSNRLEFEFTNLARRKGIRLLNHGHWIPREIPNWIVQTWYDMHRILFGHFRAGRMANLCARKAISRIEDEYPQLDVIAYSKREDDIMPARVVRNLELVEELEFDL